ncbi:glycosyltransferase family 4 protein [Leptolyngbya sp. GB1-A1]|uniref:glycosyltransferase family 4 protein n=1 Tax=Leptolyngbya sp. GB1-A1 TaxID=2933908 RepID=UPI00329A4433
MNSSRFISVQVGARRNYVVPAILAEAGLLEAFYTDLCGSAGLGGLLQKFCPKTLRKPAIQRLISRQVPVQLEGKVCTFDRAALRFLARSYLARSNDFKSYQALRQFDLEFSQAMSQAGLGKATHVYSMFGEGLAFLKFAKDRGLKIISEVYIAPQTHQIVQQQREQFPDLEPMIPSEIIERDYEWLEELCQLADRFIVPSEFVREGMMQFGVSSERCALVPYAVGDSWFTLQNQPIEKRILFVGTADLRKGIHILGIAAQKLRHLGYEFRVAGGVSDIVRQHPLTQHLTFLGRVPRTEIQNEYAQADIFVLPSQAEGSAEVIYEALAARVPIITTKAAGSVVRNGIEGFIVPEQDPETLASRIQELVEDRELRERMAIAARKRAYEHTWNRYSEELLKATLN